MTSFLGGCRGKKHFFSAFNLYNLFGIITILLNKVVIISIYNQKKGKK